MVVKRHPEVVAAYRSLGYIEDTEYAAIAYLPGEGKGVRVFDPGKEAAVLLEKSWHDFSTPGLLHELAGRLEEEGTAYRLFAVTEDRPALVPNDPNQE